MYHLKSVLTTIIFFLSWLVNAQEMQTVLNKNIHYNNGKSIFMWQQGSGLVHLSTGDDKTTKINLYNENFEKIKSLSSDEQILNYEYLGTLFNEGKTHMIFTKNSYIGFKSHGKIYDLSYDLLKVNVQQYKMPGMTNFSAFTFENNDLLLYGSEIYKKWSFGRVMKFAVSPFLFGFPLIFPVSPTVRPLICKIDNTNIDLIQRNEFKKKEYKNKLVHSMHLNEDGSRWVALTNGIKEGNDILFLEKYSKNFDKLQTVKYSVSNKSRVSMFQFYDTLTNPDTASFIIGLGNPILNGSIIKRNGIQTVNQAFTGNYIIGSKSASKLKSVKNAESIGTANDPFSKTVISTFQNNQKLNLNGDVLEIQISCGLNALQSSSSILGYYANPPSITVNNITKNEIRTFQLENPDPEGDAKSKTGRNSEYQETSRVIKLGHFTYADYISKDQQYAFAVTDSIDLYVCYITPQGDLVTYDISTNKLKEVHSTPLRNQLEKTSGHGSNYRMVQLSESKIAVLTTEVNGAGTIGGKNDGTTTHIEVFELGR